MTELWTTVPGYPRYELSNKGRMRYDKGNFQGFIKPPIDMQPPTYMIWVWNEHTNSSEVKYIVIYGVTQERGDKDD